LPAIILAVAAVGLIPAVAAAQNGNWITTTGGTYNWGDPANWSGGAVADGTDGTARFWVGLTGGVTVNLETPRTINKLVFDSGSTLGWTIAGTNPLTLSPTSANTGLEIQVGYVTDVYSPTVTIAAPLVANQGFAKSGTGTLVLTGDNTITGPIYVQSGVLAVSRTATSNPLGNGWISMWGGTLRLGIGYAGEAAQTFANNVVVPADPTIDVRSPAGGTLGD
jgi:autotransporter-associated beta strand protein